MSESCGFHAVLRREIARIQARRDEIFRIQRARENELTETPPKLIEIDTIKDLNNGPGNEDGGKDPQKLARLAALGQHHVRLALSGGGIRSATFALGVLQGWPRRSS